ncbi:AMP-binding protein [Pelagibacterium mangrovi]|uniref:AMP-binding protein n=1 Tax=Pelagibacterium mangrovi TaxID=3119828 RepID=UPI002FC7DB3A
MSSVLDPFFASCRRAPERIALIDRDGTAITYAQLQAEARGLAAHWRGKGLRPGQRVLVATPVSIGLYRSLIAIWMAGCEAIFPEPFAGLKGLRHASSLLKPASTVTRGALGWALPLLAGRWMRPLSCHAVGESTGGIVDIAPPSEVALYSFTSGSTGTPKCIARSHAFMLAQSGAVSRLLASDRPEIDLVWFPVFVLACLANGGTAVLADSALKRPAAPDTQALAAQCRRHGVTRLLAPPTVADALSREPTMPRLARVFTGGGPVMPDHFGSIAAYADEIVAVYGSTEAEPIAILSSKDLTPELMDTMRSGGGLLAGKPVEDLHLRIREDEIQVAGPHVVQSYLDPRQNPENKIAEDGVIWHRTGDGGRLDDQGRLWLRGRIGGKIEGFWPLETEMTARAWPGVTACALARHKGKPLLAIAGDPAHLPHWQQAASRLAVGVVVLEEIPMDRRHASKLDYTRLGAAIEKTVVAAGD